jgi:hypothetical protein
VLNIGFLLTLTNEVIMNISDRASDLISYFKIREDSDKIKRVEELAIKRDIAESVGNTDEVNLIDQELTTYGGNDVKVS